MSVRITQEENEDDLFGDYLNELQQEPLPPGASTTSVIVDYDDDPFADFEPAPVATDDATSFLHMAPLTLSTDSAQQDVANERVFVDAQRQPQHLDSVVSAMKSGAAAGDGDGQEQPRVRIMGPTMKVPNPNLEQQRHLRELFQTHVELAKRQEQRFETWNNELRATLIAMDLPRLSTLAQEDRLERLLTIDNGKVGTGVYTGSFPEFQDTTNELYEKMLEDAIVVVENLAAHQVAVTAVAMLVQNAAQGGELVSRVMSRLFTTVPVSRENIPSREELANDLQNVLLGASFVIDTDDTTKAVVSDIVTTAGTVAETFARQLQQAVSDDAYFDLPIPQEVVEVIFTNVFTALANASDFSRKVDAYQSRLAFLERYSTVAYRTYIDSVADNTGLAFSSDDSDDERARKGNRQAQLNDILTSLLKNVGTRERSAVGLPTLAFLQNLFAKSMFFAVQRRLTSVAYAVFSTVLRTIDVSIVLVLDPPANASLDITPAQGDASTLVDAVRHSWAAFSAQTYVRIDLVHAQLELDDLSETIRVPTCVERDSTSQQHVDFETHIEWDNADVRPSAIVWVHSRNGTTRDVKTQALDANAGTLSTDAFLRVPGGGFHNGGKAGLYWAEARDDRGNLLARGQAGQIRVFSKCVRDGAPIEYTGTDTLHDNDCFWVSGPLSVRAKEIAEQTNLQTIARQILSYNAQLNDVVSYDASIDSGVVDPNNLRRPLIDARELILVGNGSLATTIASAYTWPGVMTRAIHFLRDITRHKSFAAELRRYARDEPADNLFDNDQRIVDTMYRALLTAPISDSPATMPVLATTFYVLSAIQSDATVYEAFLPSDLAVLRHVYSALLAHVSFDSPAHTTRYAYGQRSVAALTPSEVIRHVGDNVLVYDHGVERLKSRIKDAERLVARQRRNYAYDGRARKVARSNTGCMQEARMYRGQPLELVRDAQQDPRTGRYTLEEFMERGDPDAAYDWRGRHSDNHDGPELTMLTFDSVTGEASLSLGSLRLGTAFDMEDVRRKLQLEVESYNALPASALRNARTDRLMTLTHIVNAISLYAPRAAPALQEQRRSLVSAQELLEFVSKTSILA